MLHKKGLDSEERRTDGSGIIIVSSSPEKAMVGLVPWWTICCLAGSEWRMGQIASLGESEGNCQEPRAGERALQMKLRR
jgi:hypothetical protein